MFPLYLLVPKCKVNPGPQQGTDYRFGPGPVWHPRKAWTESPKPILWLLLAVVSPVDWESSSLPTPPFLFLGEGKNVQRGNVRSDAVTISSFQRRDELVASRRD